MLLYVATCCCDTRARRKMRRNAVLLPRSRSSMSAHHVNFVRDIKFCQGSRYAFDLRPIAVATHNDSDFGSILTHCSSSNFTNMNLKTWGHEELSEGIRKRQIERFGHRLFLTDNANAYPGTP